MLAIDRHRVPIPGGYAGVRSPPSRPTSDWAAVANHCCMRAARADTPGRAIAGTPPHSRLPGSVAVPAQESPSNCLRAFAWSGPPAVPPRRANSASGRHIVWRLSPRLERGRVPRGKASCWRRSHSHISSGREIPRYATASAHRVNAATASNVVTGSLRQASTSSA